MNGMALHLNSRFQRTGSISDIDKGIHEIERILSPDDLKLFPMLQFNLCGFLHNKISEFGCIDLSTRQLELAETTLCIAPETSVHFPDWQIQH